MRHLYAVIAHHSEGARKSRLLGIHTSYRNARESLRIHIDVMGRWTRQDLMRAGHARGFKQEFTRYSRDGQPWTYEIYKVPANVDLHYGPLERGLWA